MTIDEAIKDAENTLARGGCKFVPPARYIALLRFVQAWDVYERREFESPSAIKAAQQSRAAVDEALKTLEDKA